MSRARRARRIAMAAAYGGGGVGLFGAGAAGLLVAEAKLARRMIGEPTGVAPRADGHYRAPFADDGGPPPDEIRMVVLGDSSAVGLGVDRARDTPGGQLAAGLAEMSGQRVHLRVLAAVGAESSHLRGQVDQALADVPPHVAVIMIGANDVTHQVRPSNAVRHLDESVRRLRTSGAAVVVGTCPDLGTVEPVAQPLRWIARWWSRQLAAAQTIAVVEAGGRTVSLGDLLGPEFAARPSELFGPDRFHPSAEGYRSVASALLPSVCAAIGCWAGGATEEAPDRRRGERARPVALAAAEAVESAGTEVSPTQVAGRDRGRRGRWAQLRHRRTRAVPEGAAGGAGEADGEADADPVAANGAGGEADADPAGAGSSGAAGTDRVAAR